MKVLITILKSIFFYPLMWVRGIMKFGFKLISIAFTIFGIISLVSEGEFLSTGQSVVFILIGLLFFVIGFLYDQILFKLNPTSSELTLNI